MNIDIVESGGKGWDKEDIIWDKEWGEEDEKWLLIKDQIFGK